MLLENILLEMEQMNLQLICFLGWYWFGVIIVFVILFLDPIVNWIVKNVFKQFKIQIS